MLKSHNEIKIIEIIGNNNDNNNINEITSDLFLNESIFHSASVHQEQTQPRIENTDEFYSPRSEIADFNINFSDQVKLYIPQECDFRNPPSPKINRTKFDITSPICIFK